MSSIHLLSGSEVQVDPTDFGFATGEELVDWILESPLGWILLGDTWVRADQIIGVGE